MSAHKKAQDTKPKTSLESQPKQKGRQISRRCVCLGIGSVAFCLGLGALSLTDRTQLVRPPGAQDEKHLLANCIHCEMCYEICPRNVITLAHIEDGILSMRTPQMNFNSDYCDFCAEENGGRPLCVDVCPTSCFELAQDATAQNTIIGKAEINTNWCLAYTQRGCRFCYDACPYEAIELDVSNRPYVIDDLCNGCGACESVCVSLQDASVSVGATSRAVTVKALQV